jgi:hypothetical protein
LIEISIILGSYLIIFVPLECMHLEVRSLIFGVEILLSGLSCFFVAWYYIHITLHDCLCDVPSGANYLQPIRCTLDLLSHSALDANG